MERRGIISSEYLPAGHWSLVLAVSALPGTLLLLLVTVRQRHSKTGKYSEMHLL